MRNCIVVEQGNLCPLWGRSISTCEDCYLNEVEESPLSYAQKDRLFGFRAA